MKSIEASFPELSPYQRMQFEGLYDLYLDWNEKINVISRKDIQNLYPNHVLHSLAIAKYIHFRPNTAILDVGTGGGFPGIPLAIFFPETHFVLLDSIGKKIKVAQAVADAIGLCNVETVNARVENEKRKFHFVVSRAVMPLPDLVKVVRKNIAQEQINAIPNGLLCLKGGNLEAEISPFRKKVEVTDISTYFSDPFFATKKLIYMPVG